MGLRIKERQVSLHPPVIDHSVEPLNGFPVSCKVIRHDGFDVISVCHESCIVRTGFAQPS